MDSFIQELSSSENTFSLILLFVIIFLISFLILWGIFSIIGKLIDRHIYESSEAIHSLLVLNDSVISKYFIDFDPYIEYTMRHANLKSYRDTPLETILLSYILENPKKFSALCQIVKQNIHNYNVYYQKCSEIFNQRSTSWYKKHNFESREKRLFNKLIYHPITDIHISITSEYLSPKRRNWYYSHYVFHLSDVETALGQIEKKNQYEICKERERALMTPSLRYDIMKRDQFRCVLCGASQKEGAKLHVDHIYPISKGGKTEPNNLRTLCDQCNLGKRDKYDSYGLN